MVRPMLAGHLAIGLLAKRVEPAISLGTFVLAAMLADLLWCVFMIAGMEHAQFRPGMGAANYFVASDIAMSHSLLMDTIWAALLAGAWFVWRRQPRAALVLGAAVISHWLLDLVSHRPDMPLAPRVHRYFGLGLWTSIPATVIIEGGFWLFAIVIYTRATEPRNRAAGFVFWSGAALFTLAWYSNIAGPPPRNFKAAPVVSLVFFSLMVAWACGVNCLRHSMVTRPRRAG